MAAVVAVAATGVCPCHFGHQVAAWDGGSPQHWTAAASGSQLHQPTAGDQ